MTAATVLPVASLVDRLGHLELAQKHLGLVNHAHGVRLAIVAIQEEADRAGQADQPPLVRSAMQAMASSLAGRH